jgi:RNA polymerase sigma factor (sigma-70 family)
MSLQSSDVELIERTREGDDEAYAALYQRYRDRTLLVARATARGMADAEDLLAEAFARALTAIRSGDGPRETMSPYLATLVRRLARDKARYERHLVLHDDLVTLGGAAQSAEATAMRGAEVVLAAEALASLPERWQAVLWLTEVEGERPAQLAEIFGITPRAVSALAYRAREGLRVAYLQAHAGHRSPACHPHVNRLGEYVRGRLCVRARAAVNFHLATCAECADAAAEMRLIMPGAGGLGAS